MRKIIEKYGVLTFIAAWLSIVGCHKFITMVEKPEDLALPKKMTIIGTSSQSIDIPYVGKISTGKLCELAEKANKGKVSAVTVCTYVFLCPGYKDIPDDQLGCLLIHEAHHVAANGKNLKECAKNLAKYGVDFFINKYIKKMHATDAYLNIQEEKEAKELQEKCLELKRNEFISDEEKDL